MPSYPYSTIIIPTGSVPILQPMFCNPSLEVYSVINNHANRLYTIPPGNKSISLNPSNIYRFIFFNKELNSRWSLYIKIILHYGDREVMLYQLAEQGIGQKFFRNDIIFQHQ